MEPGKAASVFRIDRIGDKPIAVGPGEYDRRRGGRTPFARAHQTGSVDPGVRDAVRQAVRRGAYGALGAKPSGVVLIRSVDPEAGGLAPARQAVAARVRHAHRVMKGQPIGDYQRFVGRGDILGRLVVSARIKADAPPPSAREIDMVEEVFDWLVALEDRDLRRLALSFAMGARPVDLAREIGRTRKDVDHRLNKAYDRVTAMLVEGCLAVKSP